MNNNYNFENTVAVKIIVRKDDKIFLLKEPQFNEWMPGKYSLPGGKLLLNESIDKGLSRKIKTEIGFNIKILGLYKIINILMPKKNVYHFLFIADWISGEIDISAIEAENAAWYTSKELMELNKNDYAEYYNNDVLKKVIANRFELIPHSSLIMQDNREDSVKKWMQQGMPDKKI